MNVNYWEVIMISLLLMPLVYCEHENSAWEKTKEAVSDIGHNVSQSAKKGADYVGKKAQEGSDAVRRAWFDYKTGTLRSAIDQACLSSDKDQQLREIRKEIEDREEKLREKINAYSKEDRKKYAHQIETENNMLTELHQLRTRCK